MTFLGLVVTSPDNSGARGYQVAILGSSGDLATHIELALATEVGREVARNHLVLLTAGDDGVMGVAAEGAKQAGGTTVAILPAAKSLQKPWLYDVVIDTGLNWWQFSDVLLRSVRGAIAIGGGAGTVAELIWLYLNQTPAVLVEPSKLVTDLFDGRSIDARELIKFPVVRSAAGAVEGLLQSANAASAGDLVQAGWALHASCYPFGDSGNYLESAVQFRLAAVSALPQSSLRSRALALYRDSLGDHAYYHQMDFFLAASCYGAAIEQLRNCPVDSSNDARGFLPYLRAILVESLALGLEEAGELDMAQVLAKEAATKYEDATRESPSAEHEYLLHSSTGMGAYADYLAARIASGSGNIAEARAKLVQARLGCEAALKHLPRWAESGFSDSYQRFAGRLRALEDQLNPDDSR